MASVVIAQLSEIRRQWFRGMATIAREPDAVQGD
jgi:hypothetical protein